MRHALATLACLVLASCMSMPPQAPVAGGGNAQEMKIAFDITDGNPRALLAKLNIIDTTRKQLIESGVTPRIVLAFRGDASYFTNVDVSQIKEADRLDAARIAGKLQDLQKANGVEALEQCNLPLASRKLRPSDVMQEVRVVPNGWISLVAWQQRGYAYIVP